MAEKTQDKEKYLILLEGQVNELKRQNSLLAQELEKHSIAHMQTLKNIQDRYKNTQENCKDYFVEWCRSIEKEEEGEYQGIIQEAKKTLETHCGYLVNIKQSYQYKKQGGVIRYNSNDIKNGVAINILDNQIQQIKKSIENVNNLTKDDDKIKKDVKAINDAFNQKNNNIRANSLGDLASRSQEDLNAIGYEFLPFNATGKSTIDRAFRCLIKDITWFNYTTQNFLLSRLVRQNAFFYNTAMILANCSFGVIVPDIKNKKNILDEVQLDELRNILTSIMPIIIQGVINSEIDGGSVFIYDRQEKNVKQFSRMLFASDATNDEVKKLFSKKVVVGERIGESEYSCFFDGEVYNLSDVFVVRTSYLSNVYGQRSNEIWGNSFFENKIVPMANINKMLSSIAEHIQHSAYCVLSDKFYERTMYGNEIQQLEIQRQMRQMATMLKNDDILRIPLGSEFDIKGHPVNITEMEDFITHYWSGRTMIPSAILRGEQDASVLTTAKDQITIDGFNSTLNALRNQYLPQITALLQHVANCYTDEVLAEKLSKEGGQISKLSQENYKDEYPVVVLTNISQEKNERALKIKALDDDVEIFNKIDIDKGGETSKILSQRIVDSFLERMCDAVGVPNEITDEDREKEAKTIQEDINEVSEGDDNDENYSDVTHQENN